MCLSISRGQSVIENMPRYCLLLLLCVSAQFGHGVSHLNENSHLKSTTDYGNLLQDEFVQSTFRSEDFGDIETDPLECCNLNDLMLPAWRSDCGFKLKWDDKERLTIVNSSETILTTTRRPSLTNKDVKIVPVSCDQQDCIFSKLNITSNGGVNKDAFSRLLDTMTNTHTEWTSAKARVVTQCLNKPLIGYDGECEINKILACTFDILTENCPNSDKNDRCKHSTSGKEGLICQISSSRYRPKHRRQFCSLPNFINKEVRTECGVNLIYKLEYVQPAVKTSRWSEVVNCQELTESSRCLLSKMNVLNKYGFIDHFRMKEYIEAQEYPSNLQNTYINTFNNGGMYQSHCSSSKKLLNVIDSIVSTCPTSRLSQNEQCQKLMRKINSRLEMQNQRQINQNYNFFTLPMHTTLPPKQNSNKPIFSIYKTNPVYNFGILGKNEPPTIQLLDLKSEKPLILLPVYERMKDPLKINSLHNDGVFRS